MEKSDTPLAPYRLSKTSTFADLAACVAGDATLEGRKGTDVQWALRTVVKASGGRMETTTLDPRKLNDLLDAFEPAAIGIGAGSWTNAKNLTRFALRRAGLIKTAARRGTQLAPEWTAVMRLLSDQGHLIGISRLARFCTERGIGPEQVDDTTFDAFLEELECQQIKSGGRKTHRRIAQIWNKLADTTRGWPNQTVQVPSYSRRYALEWSELPATLKEDLDAYLATMDGSKKRALARRKQVKPSTVKTLRHQVHILVSAIVLGGGDASSLQTLADVVTPANLDRGLEYLVERVGDDRLAQAQDVLRTMLAIARHHVKVPDEELQDFANMCQLWQKQEGREMTAKNRELLRQFDYEANVRAFLMLPDALMKKAKACEGKPTATEALLVQSALVIALLQMIPIRRHNVAGLRMSEHFERRSDGSVLLRIKGKEVKNGVEVDADLPAYLIKLLDLYIGKYRPLLAQQPSDWLIPGLADRPKSRERIANQISSTIKRELGLSVHMHLFRHISAKLYLDENPGNYGVVQRLHGHKSINTTMQIYCGAETRAATTHYQQHILDRKAGRKTTARRVAP